MKNKEYFPKNGFRNVFLAKLPGWYFYGFVFIASVLITTAFLTLLPENWSANESSDYSSFYEPVARNIIAGKGYTRDGSSFEAFYPPGYPLILAAQFSISKAVSIPEPLVLQIFIVIFTAFSVIFLFDLARRFSNTKSALLVALVWMTYPFLLWLTKQSNSELAFMAILFGACDLFFSVFYFFIKKEYLLILAGLLFGFAMLVRPIAVFFPIVLIIAILVTQISTPIFKKLIKIGIFLIGILAAVLPWEIYAYSNTGKIVFLSDNSSIAMRGGLVFAVSDDEYKQKVNVPEDVQNLMVEIRQNYNNLTSTFAIVDYLKVKLSEEPVAVIKLFGIKALRSWYATDSQRLEKYIVIIQIPYLLLILISSWFSWKKGGAARSLLIGIWLLTFCNWVMNIAVTSTLRYMVPIIGLLFVTIAQIPLFGTKQTKVSGTEKQIPASPLLTV